eukprot:2248236-Prymnesium_polylepis.1
MSQGLRRTCSSMPRTSMMAPLFSFTSRRLRLGCATSVCDRGDGCYLRRHAWADGYMYAELKKVSYGRCGSRSDLAFRRSDGLAHTRTRNLSHVYSIT